MVSTLSLRFTVASAEQPSKALSGMVLMTAGVVDDPKDMDVRAVQPLKQDAPKVVMWEGMVYDVREVQPSNALLGISLRTDVALDTGAVIEIVASLTQPLKHPEPSVTTFFGMVMDVSLVHPSKAPDSIFVMVLDIETDERLVHPLNALEPMDVIFDVNTTSVRDVQPSNPLAGIVVMFPKSIVLTSVPLNTVPNDVIFEALTSKSNSSPSMTSSISHELGTLEVVISQVDMDAIEDSVPDMVSFLDEVSYSQSGYESEEPQYPLYTVVVVGGVVVPLA